MKNTKSYKHFKITILAIVLYVLNITLILQLIPVFESQTMGANIVNLVVFPANFLFEDLFGINSVKFVDYLTWILQFVYAYLIVVLISYIIKGENNG